MLPRPPTPNAAVLKRIQAQPIDYWQHVGDPLADLLATIYPIDDAETLLKLIEYEAEQAQPLCVQFLAQESATTRWQEPRYQEELAAWQAYVQQFPLAVRLAWQAGGGLRLLSQARWAGAWPGPLSPLQRFMQHLDDALLSSQLPSAETLRLMRLELAILRRDAEAAIGPNHLGVVLAQSDLATLVICLSEEMMRCLEALGVGLNPKQRAGIRHWAIGFGQGLGVESLWLASNDDEAHALRHVLLQPPSALGAPLVLPWLRMVASADTLPAAERRTLALARSLLDPLTANTLGLPHDALGSLWRKASGWVVEKSRPLAGQAPAVLNLQKKVMARWH